VKGPAKSAPYIGLFRMRLIRGLSYQAAAVAGICTQFFWGFMAISILQAFARSGNSPLDMGQISSYIWLQQSFLMMVVIWFKDGELIHLICSGDASYELCRPVDLYWFWFARFAGGRVSAVALRCLPILALAFFLPEPWRLRLPESPAAAFAFFLSLCVGCALMVAISMFAYILTMVSLQPQAGFIFLSPVVDFCSGLVIPLPFLPDRFRAVLELLPFRYCADLPFRLWSGAIPVSQAPRLIVFELSWLVFLVFAGRISLDAALRAIVRTKT